MERRAIFRDGMDNDPADYNNLQEFVSTSLEHVVGDGISADRKYAGFAAVADGVVTMTAQPGRLYSGGKVYNRAEIFEKDFTVNLPAAAKRIALLVAYAQEVDTDARPREFLINEDTGASEPQVVAMERARIAAVNVVFGTENADPVAPIVDAGVLVIAQILLTSAGISSITMNAENALDSVSSVAARTAAVEGFQRRAEPQIGSLASDIAALTNGQKNTVGLDAYGRTLARLAVIEAKAGIPATAVDSSADFFLDAAGSDAAFAGFSAKVEEGIRFPNAAAATAAIAIANPLNPLAKVTGGVMFPAYNRKPRLVVGPIAGEVQISSFSYAAHALVQKTMSRIRIRYGSSRTVCTNSTWWKSGKYDAETRIFRIGVEAWIVDAADYERAVRNHMMIRVTQFWEDRYEDPYWEAVTVPHVVNGSQVAETFLQSNDMWLDAVGLTFTQLDANGSVTLAICETDRGLPLLDKVISKTTVARENLALGANVIPVQPVFLTGGLRYAIVVITPGNHWLATVQGSDYPQGTFFSVVDGAFMQGDATRDLMFSLYAAEFTTSRAEIALAPLQLAGGISDIDILAPAIVPGSSQLTFEVQIGAVWHPLQKAVGLVLGAGGVLPALLPFRAVFTGTPDVMPALTLTGSQVIVSRPDVALTHVSAIRALPGGGSASIRVIARLEQFDAAHHTATCKLRSGAGYATETAPSSFSDVVADDGSIERTWLFNLGGAITSYRIKFGATTDSNLDTFHFGWRKDYAL